MPVSMHESLSVFGNSNYLRCFLHDYECKIEEDKEFDKPLFKALNYFSWINIASAQVFYRIREMIYVNTENEKVFDDSYKALLNYVIKECKLSDDDLDAIILFAKIRHLLVHKGFPNPHIAPTNKELEIATGRKFTAKEVNELASFLQKPSNYKFLQSKYEMAMKAIGSFEKEMEHNFGSFQITKKRY